MIIGERLRLALNNLKISNKDLSAELNVTPQYLSSLKNQDKLTDTIVKIAEIKKISLDWLVFGVGNMFLADSSVNIHISGDQATGQVNGGIVNNTKSHRSDSTQLKFTDYYQQIEQIASWRNEEGFEELKNKLINLRVELMPHA